MIFMPMEYLNGGVYKTRYRPTQLYPKQQHLVIPGTKGVRIVIRLTWLYADPRFLVGFVLLDLLFYMYVLKIVVCSSSIYGF